MGRCRHRPLRRRMGNAAVFRPTHDFPIPVVGADDSVRPSKFVDFSWIFVGADAHIGPLKCCDFASDFRKNGQFRRADRVVRPYGAKTKPNAITSDRPRAGVFPFWGGGMGRCGHRPLRRKTGNAAVFRPTHTFCPIPFVGADDPVRRFSMSRLPLPGRQANFYTFPAFIFSRLLTYARCVL